MRTFGELQIGEVFVPVINHNTDEEVYLFRKTEEGMAYFCGVEGGKFQWGEEVGGFPDTRLVQPVSLEKPNKTLLQLFAQ